MLRYEIECEGLDDLADAFLNMPDEIGDATRDANRRIGPIVLKYVRARTPMDTGFLRRSEQFVVFGLFTLEIQATAFYAGFVLQRIDFMRLGVADAMPAIDAEYERAITDASRTLQ